MATNSKISWTHHTLNLWMGCTEKSAGCARCYAKTLVTGRMGRDLWGDDKPRPRTKTWAKGQVQKWNAAAEKTGERHRVFVGSLMDWAEGRDDQREILEDFWPIVRECTSLDFLLLTKCPQNIPGLLPSDWSDWSCGYPNVWLGTSIESAKAVDVNTRRLVVDRARILTMVPAAVHFVSNEPALGPTAAALNKWLGDTTVHSAAIPGINWLIYGGESGPGFRAEDKQWARDLRDLCWEAGVAFFHKQSAHLRNERGIELDGRIHHEFPTPRPSTRRDCPRCGGGPSVFPCSLCSPPPPRQTQRTTSATKSSVA